MCLWFVAPHLPIAKTSCVQHDGFQTHGTMPHLKKSPPKRSIHFGLDGSIFSSPELSSRKVPAGESSSSFTARIGTLLPSNLCAIKVSSQGHRRVPHLAHFPAEVFLEGRPRQSRCCRRSARLLAFSSAAFVLPSGQAVPISMISRTQPDSSQPRIPCSRRLLTSSSLLRMPSWTRTSRHNSRTKPTSCCRRDMSSSGQRLIFSLHLFNLGFLWADTFGSKKKS